jgi:hypothetical protein
MKRYFDLPDARLTLFVEVKAGSPAALASHERIRDHFKQKGAIREVEQGEYKQLKRAYSAQAGEGAE